MKKGKNKLKKREQRLVCALFRLRAFLDREGERPSKNILN